MKSKTLIWVSVLIILVFIFGFGASQLYNEFKKVEKYDFTPDTIPNSEQEILENCKNLNLTDSAFCLRDNIRLFYNFTSTDDKIAEEMTLQEIQKVGGDCGVYSYLYSRLGEGLGFNATTTKYNGVKGIFYSHRWAILWDSTHNCCIDQLSVKCRANIGNGEN